MKYVLLTLTFSQQDLPCVCSTLQKERDVSAAPKQGEVVLRYAPFSMTSDVIASTSFCNSERREESKVLATPKQGEVEILNQHGGAKYTGAVAQGWLQNFGL